MLINYSIFFLFVAILGIRANIIPLDSETSNTISSGPVSQECLKCICDAVTGCSKNYGHNAYTSGPFRITKFFWIDAGKPIIKDGDPDSSTAFEICTEDNDCAIETVQSFMKKHQRDCDNNGVIDCYDYGAIHLLGSPNCAAQMPEGYKRAYTQCREPAGITKV